MYNIMDYLILRSEGVWQVIDKVSNSLKLQEYITKTEKDILINDVDIVRKISSKEIVEDAIDRVGFIQTLKAPNDKVRKGIYDSVMEEFHELSWISIIKTIYIRQKDHKLMPLELEYSKRAKEYFHSEISILLNIEYKEVENYISDKVTSDEW